MTDQSFPYSIRINTLRRLSIIRFPSDGEIYRAITCFSQTLPPDDFYSVTRTSREISVIQDAKYPTYPQELGEHVGRQIQVEEGFVLIEVVPLKGTQIDFCTAHSGAGIDGSGDGTASATSCNFG